MDTKEVDLLVKHLPQNDRILILTLQTQTRALIIKTLITHPYLPSMKYSLAKKMRRLSDKEDRVKRGKGLCLQCDGKWSANHVRRWQRGVSG